MQSFVKSSDPLSEEHPDPAIWHQLDLFTDPPEEVREVLEELTDPEEETRLITSADLTSEGHFGETWLLATDRRIVVVNPDHGHPTVEQFALEDLEAIEKVDFVGNGALRFKTTDDQIYEPLRFSLTLADKFDDVRVVLDRLREHSRQAAETVGAAAAEPPKELAEILPEVAEELARRHEQRVRDRGRCPNCGRVMSPWANVCTHCLQKRKLLLRLFGYLKPYWKAAVGGLILMALLTAIDLVDPILTRFLIDDVILAQNIALSRKYQLLALFSIGLLAVRFCSVFIGAARGYLMDWLGQKIILGMRSQVYEHLTRLSLSFYDKRQTGRIMYRVTSDTGRLQDFVANSLQDILRDAITCVLIFGIMVQMDWKLTLLVLGPVPFIIWFTHTYGRRIHRIYHKVWHKSSKLEAIMADTIPGVRVVKAFGQEDREVQRFNETNNDIFALSMRATLMATRFYPSMRFLSTLGSITIWGYGGYLVLRGMELVRQGSAHEGEVLTVGALVAFISYLWRFYGPVHNLSHMNDRIQRAATSAERVFETLDTNPEIQDAPNAVEMPEIQGHIRFEEVTFHYEPGHNVLEDVSFEVQPGEMIGLVGPSGAGKSTTINLLCRFYDVKEGAIYIDGVDIRRIKLQSLRNQIGVVLQEPFLFHGTIAENIAYGNPQATLEEIVAAAKAANAHEFILKFPDGYDTLVGERGIRLSGGEKQRISIARAILKNPRILILDEATSSVDTETEAQIREAIDRLVKNRTTIAIAHRFSTLRNANRLVVLEEGKLVEMGTHAELMEKEDGVFARLCKIQQDLSKIQAW